MINLVRRMFAKQWLVQVALIVLLATAVTVLIIYGAFINRESASVAKTVQSAMPEGFYLVKTRQPEGLPDPARMYSASLMAAWYEEIVPSSLGELPCAYLIESPSLRAILPKGTALFPAKLAARFGLAEGETVAINHAGGWLKLQAAIYDDAEFTYSYNFGDRVLIFADQPPTASRFLYKHMSGNANSVRLQLRGAHPTGEIQDSTFIQSAGAELVHNTYNGITQAKVGLIMFITVAFLTAKILNFLDSRRTLGILKSMGLRNNEVSMVISAEGLVAPCLGIVGGVMLAKVMFVVFAQHNLGLSFTPQLALWSVATILPAILIGVYVPGRLSSLATTLDLLFHRSIPLIYEQVKTLGKRFPAIDVYAAQGVHFIKLDIVEGEFQGVILRRLGDEVKQGEVIAHGTSWWGLKVQQYVAPVTGVIVYFQTETGFIGIGPTPQEL